MGKKFRILFIGIMFVSMCISAQEDGVNRDKAVRVFFDCNWCDNDFIRKELTYVNYMRDRKDAQVHILVTSEYTGAGGLKQTFYFIGQHEYASQADTLSLYMKADATDDERRIKQLHLLKLGLVRYVAKTPYADMLQVSFLETGADEDVSDKWDSWFFEINAETYLNGEQSYKFHNLWSSVNAQRVTEELKVSFWLSYDYSENKFSFNDTTILSTTNNKRFHHYLVKSINDHWSVGYELFMMSSLYQNMDLNIRLTPAIEYNIFPYSQSNRKQLRINYTAGPRFFNYIDPTIYDMEQELLFGQKLGVAVEFRQKWGSINTSVEGSNYFHDFNLKRLEMFSMINLRLYKGLSLRMYGRVSMVHDQINLPKGDVSKEDVLLRRKQLESQYNYWGSIGLSYSFGSIFNNVVNPRFGN
jgi:hypothetical protein